MSDADDDPVTDTEGVPLVETKYYGAPKRSSSRFKHVYAIPSPILHRSNAERLVKI